MTFEDSLNRSLFFKLNFLKDFKSLKYLFILESEEKCGSAVGVYGKGWAEEEGGNIKQSPH